MTERNAIWLPMVTAAPDPVETVLRIVWSYQRRPVRVVWGRS